MIFQAQTRADLQALAACSRPVLATASTDGSAAVRLLANGPALAALTGKHTSGERASERMSGDWTLLDSDVLARFGDGARHFRAPYPPEPVTFDLNVAAARGPLRWRVAAWPLTSAHDATSLVAVAAGPGRAGIVPTGMDAAAAVEHATRAGSVWSDPASGTLWTSAGARALWGLIGDHAERTLGELLARVHPEDVADVLASDMVVEETRREFRIVGTDGEIAYVSRMSRPAGDATPGRMLHVDRDITDFRRLDRELVQTTSAAEVAARSKSEFLALMSHELRTPLNAVMGFAQVMSAEMFGSLLPRYRDYAREIGTSAEHLLTIINDILDLSRIESARVQLDKEWLDFGRAVADVATMMSETARRNGIGIGLDIDPAVRIWSEKRAVRQLTLNLVSNAVKFTDAGGHVTVSVRRSEDGSSILTVSDDGIGIPEDDLPKVVRPFVQASNLAGRAESGTGLGLAIVRALVELHAGDLRIDSRPGEGTTVTVSIPPASGSGTPGRRRDR